MKGNQMAKIISPLNNESGSVIVVAMIILTLLTILGISSTSTSTLEVQIATNSQNHQLDFYTAENGWKEAAMWLESRGTVPSWVNGIGTTVKNIGSNVTPYGESYTAPSDGIDNDGNGVVDDEILAPDYSSILPDSSADADGIDNDGDGTVDEAGETSTYGIQYFYGITHLPNRTAKVPGSSFKYQRHFFAVISQAKRENFNRATAEIEVDVSKIYSVGYN
jgi:hypothetical protein